METWPLSPNQPRRLGGPDDEHWYFGRAYQFVGGAAEGQPPDPAVTTSGNRYEVGLFASRHVENRLSHCGPEDGESGRAHAFLPESLRQALQVVVRLASAKRGDLRVVSEGVRSQRSGIDY